MPRTHRSKTLPVLLLSLGLLLTWSAAAAPGDADDDGIPDSSEGAALGTDTDLDGIPDYLDTNSDADGALDAIEGEVDSDSDGFPDFRDRDSDGDGVLDDNELGCPGSSTRTLADSDADGDSDLVETTLGSLPCDPMSDSSSLVDLLVVLTPDAAAPALLPLSYITPVQPIDLLVQMDTTGSMGGEITNLKVSLSSQIIPAVSSVSPNPAFGVSEYRDFPVSTFGSPGDLPFVLRQRISTNPVSAQAAVNVLATALGAGNDSPESGWEALFQAATGAGGASWSGGSIPPFNPSGGLVPGVADGTIGGVGFRAGALPVIVQVTDDVSHDASDYGSAVTGEHSAAQARSALASIGARVVGIASSSTPVSELKTLAADTGAVVPTCAFVGVLGCAAGQCCTGLNGVGVQPIAGVCPLVFEIGSNGSGLGTAISNGIAALSVHGQMDIALHGLRDEAEFSSSGIDTSCFLENIVAVDAQGTTPCTDTAQPADLESPFGSNESFIDVTPETELGFELALSNPNCAPAITNAQVFSLGIDLVADGIRVVQSRQLTVLVSPVDLSRLGLAPEPAVPALGPLGLVALVVVTLLAVGMAGIHRQQSF